MLFSRGMIKIDGLSAIDAQRCKKLVDTYTTLIEMENYGLGLTKVEYTVTELALQKALVAADMKRSPFVWAYTQKGYSEKDSNKLWFMFTADAEALIEARSPSLLSLLQAGWQYAGMSKEFAARHAFDMTLIPGIAKTMNLRNNEVSIRVPHNFAVAFASFFACHDWLDRKQRLEEALKDKELLKHIQPLLERDDAGRMWRAEVGKMWLAEVDESDPGYCIKFSEVESFNAEFGAALTQAMLRLIDSPIGATFTWVDTDDEPMPDYPSGGWAIVTQDNIALMADGWLESVVLPHVLEEVGTEGVRETYGGAGVCPKCKQHEVEGDFIAVDGSGFVVTQRCFCRNCGHEFVNVGLWLLQQTLTEGEIDERD